MKRVMIDFEKPVGFFHIVMKLVRNNYLNVQQSAIAPLKITSNRVTVLGISFLKTAGFLPSLIFYHSYPKMERFCAFKSLYLPG